MRIDESSMTPIYVQIADVIENDILGGKLKEGDNCYSQLVLAKELQVNPATAGKGIHLLVDRGILLKQRGQPMTVAAGARERILERKKEEEFEVMIETLVQTAKKLGISKETVLENIQKLF